MTMQAMGPTAFPKPRGPILYVIAALGVVWVGFAIAINWLRVGERLFESLFLVPGKLYHGEVWRFFTAPLVHEITSRGAVFAILFQIYALYIFGMTLQKDWGPKRTAIFLAASVFFGEAVQLLFDAVLPMPDNAVLHPGVTFGAGAMVDAVLIAWGLSNRDRTMMMFFFPMTGMMLVWITLGLWVLFFIAAGPPPEGAFASLGGMGIGWALGGGTPSPLRKAYLRWKLKSLETSATSKRAADFRLRTGGPDLRVIRGDKSDEPPRDKRTLN